MAFGTERILFGSNYPVDKLMRPYDFIVNELMSCCESNGLGEAEQTKIFKDNAARIYRLTL